MADIQRLSTVSSASAAAASSAGFSQYANTSISLPRELLGLPLRALYRVESFTFNTLPRHFARLTGLEDIASHIWGRALRTGLFDGDTATAATQTTINAGGGVAEAAAQETGVTFADIFDAIRRFGGFFSYVTSRWSFACFTVAVVLNRVNIYGSTRRHISFNWTGRLALRIVPILLLSFQILALLRTIRCQTSPDYPLIRYGKPGKWSVLDLGGTGGFMYRLSSATLPWETDRQSCSAVKMVRPTTTSEVAYGSFSILWPVFLRLCLSHFVEVLSCALQGRTVAAEAGMSLFEHSLAFSEAESMISHSIGLGLFGLTKKSSVKGDAAVSSESVSSLQHLTRSDVLDRMNVTPELLLILVISCCNSLSSNILEVFGQQSRYRLANTTIWGICYMIVMIWGVFSSSPFDNGMATLRFPTVCFVGFVPHLLMLLGILLCFMIYALALAITAFSLPLENPQSISLRERFVLAHENMQGGHQIANVRISRYEDFYAALLRLGYAALNAASEAVFLNEGQSVVLQKMTWLEEDRLTEVEASRQNRWLGRNRADLARDIPLGAGSSASFDVPERPSRWESGYSREKKIENVPHEYRSLRRQTESGVGGFRGASRCYQGISFFRGISILLLRWTACGVDKALDSVGIKARPRWLRTAARSRKSAFGRQNTSKADSLDFWILTEDGELELPDDNEFDVEEEMRKRERLSRARWNQTDERRLDEKLYTWWKAGGSWGNQDQSPDYNPSDDYLDDTTSVVSMSSATSDSEWEDQESDGRRTPTQADPFPANYSREGTPLHETLLDPDYLAHLLNPRDRETRQEARILAAHLAAGRDGTVMTRSQYRRQVEREKARVLLSSRYAQLDRLQPGSREIKPTPEEESEMLENLILSRRSEASASHWRGDGQTWASGASGLGSDGPLCVVCQTNPRCIITWPCRCLCICEECRVSLAMNNFGSCVTCRREVGGFLRLWVP